MKLWKKTLQELQTSELKQNLLVQADEEAAYSVYGEGINKNSTKHLLK